MAWSEAFVAALSRGRGSLTYLLEASPQWEELGVAVAYSTHRVPGALPRISVGAVQVRGAGVDPRTMASTIGAWSCVYTGDLSELARHIVPGVVCLLRASLDGSTPSDIIAVGQLRQATGTKVGIRLDFFDLAGVMRSRLCRELDADLFSELGSSALGASYTPGDSTLTFAGAVDCRRQAGIPGAVYVVPGTGDPFYLTWAAYSSGSLTGVSSAGVYGTTAVAAASSSRVDEVARIVGHPCDIVRRVVCSREGDTSNGAFDSLPRAWAIGLSHALVDHADVSQVRDRVMSPASGSLEWDVVVTERISDGWSWMTALLARGGAALTVRQGLLTVRAVQASRAPRLLCELSIRDADVAEILDYEAWDASHAPEYAAVSVAGPDTTVLAYNLPGTLPKASLSEWSLDGLVTTNGSACQQELLERVQEAQQRRPERLRLRLAGLHFARLAPLDVVPLTLTSRGAQSRRGGWNGWVAEEALVTRVDPAWSGGYVDVELRVYPPSEEAYQ